LPDDYEQALFFTKDDGMQTKPLRGEPLACVWKRLAERQLGVSVRR
jgi:hypothetical protein